jgi:hypothetical protein
LPSGNRRQAQSSATASPLLDFGNDKVNALRTEIFGRDFPESPAIMVAGFAQPEMMIEIQCAAVV